jgi:glycosyltransferase involved in cell wall biosynthesis
VFACCDAYLNPPRYGGGSSAAFAMAMGLPVLTLATGDVANIAGERFIFHSFDDITQFVMRAVAVPAYRNEWSAMARARFAQISDREAMLATIMRGIAARADLRVNI